MAGVRLGVNSMVQGTVRQQGVGMSRGPFLGGGGVEGGVGYHIVKPLLQSSRMVSSKGGGVVLFL